MPAYPANDYEDRAYELAEEAYAIVYEKTGSRKKAQAAFYHQLAQTYLPEYGDDD